MPLSQNPRCYHPRYSQRAANEPIAFHDFFRYIFPEDELLAGKRVVAASLLVSIETLDKFIKKYGFPVGLPPVRVGFPRRWYVREVSAWVEDPKNRKCFWSKSHPIHDKYFHAQLRGEEIPELGAEYA